MAARGASVIDTVWELIWWAAELRVEILCGNPECAFMAVQMTMAEARKAGWI